LNRGGTSHPDKGKKKLVTVFRKKKGVTFPASPIERNEQKSDREKTPDAISGRKKKSEGKSNGITNAVSWAGGGSAKTSVTQGKQGRGGILKPKKKNQKRRGEGEKEREIDENIPCRGGGTDEGISRQKEESKTLPLPTRGRSLGGGRGWEVNTSGQARFREKLKLGKPFERNEGEGGH